MSFKKLSLGATALILATVSTTAFAASLGTATLHQASLQAPLAATSASVLQTAQNLSAPLQIIKTTDTVVMAVDPGKTSIQAAVANGLKVDTMKTATTFDVNGLLEASGVLAAAGQGQPSDASLGLG